MRGWARQIGAFSVVGLVATATHVATGMTLYHLFEISAFYANFFAFFTAMSVTILGNARFTFGARLTWGRTARAAAGVVATLALNQAIVALIVDMLGLPYEAALAAIVATVPAASFLILKYWAFRG